ncbi:phosphoribosylglycinamide formyltransferase [Pseudoalteromonas aurantia]|uniref:Phosphoribosylglycinamide formyltransferase n=1 Tax=Pseudoalteromonas aurantia TaxID=43654 RepID=A0A5S3VCG4_9GAMM|nr:phosphoribosylglycinamide formyltransferase [Pseudoalteromonas aurantia]TMO63342.1 phosphoribosylglycinamide formyltransferase [Pseudoalteromonas aurantia]TMO69561.1 phosphoribosylglycinamide formyltransferase [Pseudoalteromonas aurantia]TMO74339.1 phosphoribosylglycinamide formyltransferase [Pseudoalteromonas aurantia]
MTRSRLVVLISGSGSNLQAIIDACQNNEVNGEICAVISNKADAYGLVRAQNAGIETAILSHKDYPSREDYDIELAALIDSFNPDLVVLAGFMRILTPRLVQKFKGKMLNIHPSLLPKYQGLNTHQRAIDAKDDVHGVSVHFVTEELDGGPVVLQAKVPILADDTADTLAKRIHEQEHVIYPLVVKWFSEHRLTMEADYAVFDNQPLPAQGAAYPE